MCLPATVAALVAINKREGTGLEITSVLTNLSGEKWRARHQLVFKRYQPPLRHWVFTERVWIHNQEGATLLVPALKEAQVSVLELDLLPSEGVQEPLT